MPRRDTRLIAAFAIVVVIVLIVFALVFLPRHRPCDGTAVTRATPLLAVSPPQAIRGPRFEAAQVKKAERRAQRAADLAIIAPLREPVYRFVFGREKWDAGVQAALDQLTRRQVTLLRQWLIRHAPRDALGGRPVAQQSNPWVEVGSLRSQPESQALSDVRIAPLFAQLHATERRRFNYRLRFRDSYGGEAWVQIGDDDGLRDGLRWIRHGAQVDVLGLSWTAFLDAKNRDRIL